MPLRIELLDSSSSSFDLFNAAEEKKKKIVIAFPDFGQKFQSLTSSNKFNISHRSATDRECTATTKISPQCSATIKGTPPRSADHKYRPCPPLKVLLYVLSPEITLLSAAAVCNVKQDVATFSVHLYADAGSPADTQLFVLS